MEIPPISAPSEPIRDNPQTALSCLQGVLQYAEEYVSATKPDQIEKACSGLFQNFQNLTTYMGYPDDVLKSFTENKTAELEKGACEQNVQGVGHMVQEAVRIAFFGQNWQGTDETVPLQLPQDAYNNVNELRGKIPVSPDELATWINQLTPLINQAKPT